MGEQKAVKLLGAWCSPFSFRVICSLKLKGIPYEYVEEDLHNKSSLLLQHNPVHKKIPVLLHGDKSICESLVILEYIDEVWPQCPLLPDDPYERAIAQFWIKFIDDKSPSFWMAFQTSGEEQENAVRESFEVLETIEEKALLGKDKFFGGDQVGMLDIVLGSLGYWVEVSGPMIGIELLDPTKFPRFHNWLNYFKEAPVTKENLPDPQLMFAFFKRVRETKLAQTSN